MAVNDDDDESLGNDKGKEKEIDDFGRGINFGGDILDLDVNEHKGCLNEIGLEVMMGNDDDASVDNDVDNDEEDGEKRGNGANDVGVGMYIGSDDDVGCDKDDISCDDDDAGCGDDDVECDDADVGCDDDDIECDDDDVGCDDDDDKTGLNSDFNGSSIRGKVFVET